MEVQAQCAHLNNFEVPDCLPEDLTWDGSFGDLLAHLWVVSAEARAKDKVSPRRYTYLRRRLAY